MAASAQQILRRQNGTWRRHGTWQSQQHTIDWGILVRQIGVGMPDVHARWQTRHSRFCGVRMAHGSLCTKGRLKYGEPRMDVGIKHAASMRPRTWRHHHLLAHLLSGHLLNSLGCLVCHLIYRNLRCLLHRLLHHNLNFSKLVRHILRARCLTLDTTATTQPATNRSGFGDTSDWTLCSNRMG